MVIIWKYNRKSIFPMLHFALLDLFFSICESSFSAGRSESYQASVGVQVQRKLHSTQNEKRQVRLFCLSIMICAIFLKDSVYREKTVNEFSTASEKFNLKLVFILKMFSFSIKFHYENINRDK